MRIRRTVPAALGGTLVASVSLFGTACRAEERQGVLVRTEAGVVRGVNVGQGDSAIRRFTRVPYAAPPTGELRWRPPSPPMPWQGPYDASRPMPACPQDIGLQAAYVQAVGRAIGAPPDTSPTAPATRYAEGVGIDEDCLYLSVWTPAATRGRHPVMVWFHGGSNVHGWGGDPFFDGAALARRGVVVVVPNYRLGVLGFLTHPALAAESGRGTSGNYGLLDQLAALAWVRRNIGAFGGDSTRVTAFGQSAGATDIACLLTSPLAEGLVHRAILQSGDCLMSWADARRADGSLSAADSLGLRLGGALQLPDGAEGLAALRRLSPDSLRHVADRLGLAFDPVVDGWVLPGPPAMRAARGELLRIPVMVGSNADEASSLVPPGFPPDSIVLRHVLAREYGADADSLLGLYAVGELGDVRRALVALRTDAWFAEPSRTTASLVAAAGAPAFLYRLSRGASVPTHHATFGAFHGAELPYVFSTNPARWPYVDEEGALGRLIADYWVSFAASGDPNGGGRPVWPRYDASAPRLLELDRSPRVRPAADPRLDRLEAARRRGGDG